MEEKIKNENRVNKNNYPDWVLTCKCKSCIRLKDRLGINGNEGDLNNDKPQPGFTFGW